MDLNDSNIHLAVWIWNKDQQNAINIYGLIQEWDVSKVTNMKGLFLRMKYFNDDINNWNVSNVTNMQDIFMGLLHLIKI